jgi:hypothetical protein
MSTMRPKAEAKMPGTRPGMTLRGLLLLYGAERGTPHDLFAMVFQFAARFSAPRCETAKIV